MGKKSPATSAKAKKPEPVLESEHGDDEVVATPLNTEGPDSESESQDDEADDQTATLLKGFESSDEEDVGQGEQIDGKRIAEAGIPDEKKVKKKLEKLGSREKTTPGIIYLGRIPHGFYEHEMRAYFSQFGTVTRLRLSRNKKTGQSKHYAFIEFSDEEVAQIVADTMNNYLLFGHILKCKVVPRDNIEYVESLFKGANRRFKPRPAAKLAKAKMEKKKPEEVWEKKLDRENRKRKSVNARLSAKGIEYEFEAPVARKAVEKSAVAPAIEEHLPEGPVQMPAEKPADKAVAKKSAKKTTARVKKTKKEKKVKA